MSEVTVIDGFLIFALRIPGHSLYYDKKTGVISLDGKDVTLWADLQAQESQSS
jgi:hypothetical protein